VCPTTNRRLHGLLPVDTIIDGKYRIDGIIGVGGMGVVYRAEHTKIARQVALKMLLPEYIVYPDLVARVEREARTAGQIEHPNVVSIVDLGSTADHGPYIAMELLRGAELATVVEKAGGNLDPAEAVDIMRQALAGLEAAHKRGVIHRDLKPENIFLATLDDGSRVVKVLDFGISKLRDDSQLNSLTRTGTVMGTPQFMAPEQAAGARDQDVRIDLYACGAVLYAVLCNGLPYEAENYNLLINEILNKPPIPILARNPKLDPRLAAIVMKSIAKRPEHRYQTARAMSDALAHWYDNRNTPYVPERVLTTPAPPARTRASEPALQASSPRQSIDPRFGAGAREVARRAPQAITPFGEALSPDDPAYVDQAEATMVVPTVLPEGVIEEELDEYLEPIAVAPRGSRPSAPRSGEGRPSDVPSLSVLIESPLDAPPLVLPQEPKPPPTDDTWAKLSPTHPSSATQDPLDDSILVSRKSRVWPYVLLLLVVGGAGAAVAVHRFAPHTWHAITRALGLSAAPTLPPPAPPNVHLIDPALPSPTSGALAPIPSSPRGADATVAPTDASSDVATVLDENPDATDATAEGAARRRHRRRDH
jgi:serine/threonine-protein kinase